MAFKKNLGMIQKRSDSSICRAHAVLKKREGETKGGHWDRKKKETEFGVFGTPLKKEMTLQSGSGTGGYLCHCQRKEAIWGLVKYSPFCCSARRGGFGTELAREDWEEHENVSLEEWRGKYSVGKEDEFHHKTTHGGV